MPNNQTIIDAKSYDSRDDLESQIGIEFGLTAERKNAVIEGTREELKRLHLAHGSFVWGIPVKEKGFKKDKRTIHRIDRGKLHQFGVSDTPSVDITNSVEA